MKVHFTVTLSVIVTNNSVELAIQELHELLDFIRDEEFVKITSVVCHGEVK